MAPTFAGAGSSPGCFGLVHGFGFSSALKGINCNLAGSHLLVSLFCVRRIGIEIGQLAVLCALVPALRLVSFRGAMSEQYVTNRCTSFSYIACAGRRDQGVGPGHRASTRWCAVAESKCWIVLMARGARCLWLLLAAGFAWARENLTSAVSLEAA